MKQKHFMDIERACEGGGLKACNTEGFRDGDIVQISEKIDGSNASVRYDAETGRLAAFSRKTRLDAGNTLNGFFDYAEGLDPAAFAANPDFTVFGEWLTRHVVKYSAGAYGKWYVYDIWDAASEGYLPQGRVKEFCAEVGLEYVHVLYEGIFPGWKCTESLASLPSAYSGGRMEGVVVKNQTRLNDPDESRPFVLKYVNAEFTETRHANHIRKITDPEHEAGKKAANDIAESVVTENRVRKELLKMQDEGILPAKIRPEDMAVVAKMLPERILDDCMKEEPEAAGAAGPFFERACRTAAMRQARAVILG